jgi:hypothetical protein
MYAFSTTSQDVAEQEFVLPQRHECRAVNSRELERVMYDWIVYLGGIVHHCERSAGDQVLDLRLVVVRLIEDGHTQPEVAALCGISLSSVGRYMVTIMSIAFS